MKQRITWPAKATGTSIRQINKASSRGQLNLIRSLRPNKGNNMNEITNDTPEVPFGEKLVEILDAEGNPTGQYTLALSEGEAAPAEATVFTTAEDGEHIA